MIIKYVKNLFLSCCCKGSLGMKVTPYWRIKKMQDVTITTDQGVIVSFTPVTPRGQPAPLDGPIRGSIQSGQGVLEQFGDPSENKFKVFADLPGDVVVLFVGDADLGEGFEEVADTLRVTIQGARASSLGGSTEIFTRE